MTKPVRTGSLDIQRGYICTILFDPQDVSVEHVAVKPFGAVAADDFWDTVAGELKGIAKEVRFPGGGIVCSVPGDMAVVRTLEADSDEPDQDAVLRWELEAGLLGPVGDYACDFYEVDPGNQVDRRRYIAAAVRKETLAKLNKAVKGAKLNPYIIDIDLFALTNVFQTNYRERLGGAAALVHAEHGCAKVILVSNASYIDCCIAGVSADGIGAGDYAALLGEEISRLAGRNREALPGDVPVYLAGSLFSDRMFASAALEGIPQSEMLDPFRKVACAAGMEPDQLRTYSPQLAVAVGLALRGDEA